MKIIKRVLLAVILLTVFAVGYFYFGNYSEGVRAGYVVKLSKKGVLFKTHEGQLNLETFGASKSPNILNEVFEFSVDGSNDAILKDLNDALKDREHVSLHYVEKFITFPWRGDTKYFIIKVERHGK